MRVHLTLPAITIMHIAAGCHEASTPPGERAAPAQPATWEGYGRSPRDGPGAAAGSLDALGVRAVAGREGQWAHVSGVVHSTHRPQSGEVFILNLGPDWRTCFKAVIFRDDFEKWDGDVGGINAAYARKRVVVEGKVTMYDALPQIIVHTPSQILVIREVAE